MGKHIGSSEMREELFSARLFGKFDCVGYAGARSTLLTGT